MRLIRLDLDYNYWAEWNSYYSPSKLAPSTDTCLKHFAWRAKKGLTEEVANGFSTNFALVSEIERRIKSQENSNSYDDDELLVIFDLIQAWGGKMGKTPYVRPKGNVYRDQRGFASKYRSSILLAENENRDPQKVLKEFRKMEGIGISFATKHMCFWSKYNSRIVNKFLVYDVWMESLFRTLCRRKLSYVDYLDQMELTADKNRIDVFTVEKGLFSFLNSYFEIERQHKRLRKKTPVEKDGKDREWADWLLNLNDSRTLSPAEPETFPPKY